MREFVSRTKWSFFDKVMGLATILILSLVLFKDEIGGLEGRFFPAAAPMTLLTTVEVDGSTIFSGLSSRLRPACSPRRLEWFLGERGSQRVPVVVNWGPPNINPNGDFAFHGWVAEVTPPDLFTNGTHGDVIHRCRIFTKVKNGVAVGGFNLPWETRTRFWR